MSHLRDPIDRVAKAINAGRAQHRATIAVDVDDLTTILAAAISQMSQEDAERSPLVRHDGEPVHA